MKVSIIIPVYYNEDNLRPLYADIKEKFIEKISYDYEIVMVNDGSKDNSYAVIQELAVIDKNIKPVSLSRNYGSHAATLCGLNYATGDCIVCKAADLQEPTELLIDMVDKWKEGYNVVLAVRKDREEGLGKVFFSNVYYWMVRKMCLPSMPKKGFDIWLIDKKVKTVLLSLDEVNSSLSGQILWSGFKTAEVPYIRKARKIGKSRWTLKKKIRLVMDTMFSFSTVPVKLVSSVGFLSLIGAIGLAVQKLIAKLAGNIPVEGWTTLIIFNLFSFGIIMFSIGILGEYIWRIFDASRSRPPYIVEEDNESRDVRDDLKK